MRKLTSNERKLVLEYAKKLLEIKTSWDNRFENLGKILSFNYDNMNSSDQKLYDSIFFSYYRYYNDGDKLGFKKAELQKIGCSDATIDLLIKQCSIIAVEDIVKPGKKRRANVDSTMEGVINENWIWDKIVSVYNKISNIIKRKFQALEANKKSIDRRIMLMQHSAMKSNLNYNTGL